MVKPVSKNIPVIPQETQPQKNQLDSVKPKIEKGILLSVHFSSIIRYITNSICTGFESLKNTQMGNSLKVVLPLRIPFSILNIRNSMKEFNGASKDERVDESLNIISEVGTIADTVATATDGFVTVGLASAQVAAWTLPLFGVGFGLQAAGLALTMKSLVETHRFSKTFKKSAALKEKVESYSIDYFNKTSALITSQNKRFVKKHLGIDNKDLNARLIKIKIKAANVFSSEDELKKQKYQAKMKNIVSLLDKRITVMKQSKAFTIATTIVGIAGVIAVLASPAAPVGFALLGISAAFELGHYLKLRSITKKFEKEMKLKIDDEKK